MVTEPPTALRQDLRFVIASAGILGVGLFLRLFHIGVQGLWLDEALSFHLATHPNWQNVLLREANPPLYFLLLRIWITYMGHTEAAVRSLSAVCGLLFVVAVIWAGRKMFTAEVGLWSGAFAAVAPLHIYYSQETRAYALLTLALLLSYITLWRALEAGTRRSWLLFSSCTLVALYTHFFALLGLIPTALLVLLWPEMQAARQKWTYYSCAAFLSGFLFLPWVLWSFVFTPHAEGVHVWISHDWKLTPPILAIPRSLEVLALGSEKGLIPQSMKQFSVIDFPTSLRFLGLSILVLLGAWASIPCGDSRLGIPWLRKRKAWVGILLLFPLLTLWLVSFYKPYYVVGRYDVVAFPAYALLVGFAFAKIHRSGKAGTFLVSLIALLLFITIAAKLFLYYKAPSVNDDDKVTAERLLSYVENGDVVVFSGYPGLSRGSTILYYLRRLDYIWQDGYCQNQPRDRIFACRIHPRFTADLIFDFDNPTRVTFSPEISRTYVQEFVSKVVSPRNAVWVVSNVHRGTETIWISPVLGAELRRLGYYPSSPPILHDIGVVKFQRL